MANRYPSRTQAANDALGDAGQIRMVAKGFALVDIGDVHLHERDGHAGQGIAQRDAGVGQAARVDDDIVDTFLRGRCVDAVDQRPFVVALKTG